MLCLRQKDSPVARASLKGGSVLFSCKRRHRTSLHRTFLCTERARPRATNRGRMRDSFDKLVHHCRSTTTLRIQHLERCSLARLIRAPLILTRQPSFLL